MNKTRFTLLVGSFLFLSQLVACSPTKGYSGPELPPDKTSLIDTEYNSNEVSIGTASVDGFEVGWGGIMVLPGSHRFQVNATLKDPPRFCRDFPEMDRSGYNECLRKKNSCDCHDYMTIKQNCIRTLYDIYCSGDMRTLAGKKYELQVRKMGSLGSVNVQQADVYSSVGTASCSTNGSREEEEESTSSSSAYSYGCPYY